MDNIHLPAGSSIGPGESKPPEILKFMTTINGKKYEITYSQKYLSQRLTDKQLKEHVETMKPTLAKIFALSPNKSLSLRGLPSPTDAQTWKATLGEGHKATTLPTLQNRVQQLQQKQETTPLTKEESQELKDKNSLSSAFQDISKLASTLFKAKKEEPDKSRSDIPIKRGASHMQPVPEPQKTEPLPEKESESSGRRD